MSEQLLEKVSSFFPSSRALRVIRSTEWRHAITQLAAFLETIEDSERRSLYETFAALGAHDPDTDRYARIQRWFFLHPTFEVFEDFRSDIEVCTSFADYVALLTRCLNGHGSFSRRRFKRLLDERRPNEQASVFSRRYASLLGTHFGLCSEPRTRGPRRALCLASWERVVVTEQSLSESVRKMAEHILKMECIDLMQQEGNLAEMLRTYAPAMAKPAVLVQPVSIPPELVDDFFLRLDAEIHPRLPGWSPIASAAAFIGGVMRKGEWPRFQIVDQAVDLKPEVVVSRYELDMSLLHQVHQNTLPKATQLVRSLRRVVDGLLSVGLKLHCLNAGVKKEFEKVLPGSYFQMQNADAFLMPPFGSATAAVKALGALENLTGINVLDNEHVQIQVCSPGGLSHRRAAVLGICAYLGSDRLRRYARGAFYTSHATGKRPVIYGAGVLDTAFEWWSTSENGELVVQTTLPEFRRTLGGRTDVLACSSARDVENVNLVATLLVHAQYGGYWKQLGEQFSADVETLLEKHLLSGLLDVQWVSPATNGGDDFEPWFAAFEELMDYAFAERERIVQMADQGDTAASRQGILFEMAELLDHYRQELEFQANDLQKGGEA